MAGFRRDSHICTRAQMKHILQNLIPTLTGKTVAIIHTAN